MSSSIRKIVRALRTLTRLRLHLSFTPNNLFRIIDQKVHKFLIKELLSFERPLELSKACRTVVVVLTITQVFYATAYDALYNSANNDKAVPITSHHSSN